MIFVVFVMLVRPPGSSRSCTLVPATRLVRARDRGSVGRGRGLMRRIPARWEDVTPAWIDAAIGRHHPDARVSDVELVTRDDGTNRRARFAMRYAGEPGPATVFAKAHRSEEHTSELQSLMRISYAVFCWKKQTRHTTA